MNKRTAEELATQLRAMREDTNGNVYTDTILIDIINDAISDLHTLLVACHKEGFIGIEWPWVLLDIDDFSYANTITLPDDFFLFIEARHENSTDVIKLYPWKDIFDDNDDVGDRACIYASSISSPLPDSNNAGTDDFQLRGDFTGDADTDYAVEIDGTGTTFQWSNDGGSTWEATGVAITGEWQTLEEGIQIKFESTSGYTAGDLWTFSGYISKIVFIFKTNYNPDENIEFSYTRRPDLIDDLGDDYGDDPVYLPYPQFYESLKGISEIRCRAFNEENINIQSYVNGPAMKRIKEFIRHINVGSDLKYTEKYPDNESYL